MRRFGLAAAALLVAHALLAAPAPARAQDEGWDGGDDAANFEDDAPDPGEYNQALAPYGSWVADPRYGTVWRPAVGFGWRPYVDGNWVWTAYGWTWMAPGPWAWTFHYGRWTYLPLQGWVWLPGTVWGPAWVDWYYGDGFVGWAPLGPAVTHVTVVNNFIFVRDRDFCSRRLNHVVVDHRRVPRHVVRDWGRRDFRAPVPGDIERVSRHRVVRVDGRPRDTVAPWRRDRDGRPGRGGNDTARGARPGDGARERGAGHGARRGNAHDATGVAVSPQQGQHPRRDRGERTAVVDPAPGGTDGSSAVRVRRDRPGGGGVRPNPEPHAPMVGTPRPRDGSGGGGGSR